MMNDISECKKVLIRSPNWVGDAVMATPAFRAIRQGLPQAEITLLAKPGMTGIFRGGDWFDRVMVYSAKGDHKGLLGFLKICSALRRESFDLGFLFPNSFSSALMMSLGRVQRKVGYRLDRRGWLLSHPVEPEREEGWRRKPSPMVEYYLGLCDAVGLQCSDRAPHLFITEEEEREADGFFQRKGLSQNDSIIALNPGSAFGSSKMWRPEAFGQVGDELATRHDCRILILCGPGEEEIALRIERAMETTPVNTAENPVPLGLLKALIQRCELLISTDTGPRHFAVALNRPVVVIMGPTDARFTQKNLEKSIVLQENVECGPCHLKECPTDHKCMEKITPARVVAAAEKLLSRV